MLGRIHMMPIMWGDYQSSLDLIDKHLQPEPAFRLNIMASEGDISSSEDRGPLRPAPTSSKSTSRPRIKPTACRRCHSRKVKCSGEQPCKNCQQVSKGAECTYPRRNRMVKVSQRYIDDLIAENQRLKNTSNAATQSRADALLPEITVAPVMETTDNAVAIPPPSLDERPWFFDMNIPHTPILIGNELKVAVRLVPLSSDWS
ncbi:uncharacterized protein LY79DRAFT_556342 [Colletotrichum navitas]|uniref:Zn(2)-C6 fungal-type domain-containing protein n=1 Tax=Colletotrichum navitas TaxID=681940 RepID=A0AAD8V523_9PEZI|nr:uncharacterized protein LY79DRAFT_556342 [Colletotrichum navitas]KAK1589803.1 hypothetical protein LY79DRAFT_556342 [Colletotrichum navitas]